MRFGLNNAPFLLLLFLVGSAGIALLTPDEAQANSIQPDNTLPENSRVTRQGNIRRIEGGTRSGGNLFHSFEEFSVPDGAIADFINGNAQNIFTRVTGNSSSRINGTIRAEGTANLFLLNPNGILFGRNASLNIGGSFLATTADSINFQDGFQFSAVNPQVAPLLTVSVPVGLQFGRNPGIIRNASLADGETGLQVNAGQTLALIGGGIEFPGGGITVEDGRVELGGVGGEQPVKVGLNTISNGWTLTYDDVQNFQDIQLSAFSFVDVSGESGGSIQIQGRNVTLIEGSQIAASVSTGATQAGNIIVRASETIQLSGVFPAGGNSFPTSIGSQVAETSIETASGGDVRLQSRRLIIQDGASIETSTFGRGSAGNIFIQADSIELSGAFVYGTEQREEILSLISAKVGDSRLFGEAPIEETGNAGNITIRARQLTIAEGGQISSSGRNQGRGGNVDVQATESIQISGSAPRALPAYDRSGIFVSAEASSTGGITTADAGRMILTAPELIVEGGSGNFGGEISANNFGSGRGGRITINANRLLVQDGGIIRATSIPEAEMSGLAGGLGLAGDVVIRSDVVLLNRGQITAETGAGRQANANIRLEDFDLLLLRNTGRISARAIREASGGNVDLQASNGYLIAELNQNNDIVANAESGAGGAITVNTRGIVGLEEGLSNPPNNTNDLDASSEGGPQGTVTIIQPELDPSQGLIELPSTPVDASSLIAQTCPTGEPTDDLSEFVITGRGGLPPSPADPHDDDAILTDWAGLEDTQELNQEQAVSELRRIEEVREEIRVETPEPWNHDRLIEAQGWKVGDRGEVILLAHEPTVTSLVAVSTRNCHQAEVVEP